MLRNRLCRVEALLLLRERAWAAKRPPRRLQTAQDVIDLVHEQVEAVRADPGSDVLEKARTIGYLAGVARKAIETGELAARLAMLETILRQRPRETPT